VNAIRLSSHSTGESAGAAGAADRASDVSAQRRFRRLGPAGAVIAPTDPRSVLPLSTAAFYILLALADGDRHGYSISKEVDAHTGGTVKLGPGTLYRVIKQMLADGWIAETRSASVDDDERRRTYELSPWGRRIAEAEAQRLAKLVLVARSRRLLPANALA
jgi:DNA-binding PadR family transcriptional regulator